MKTTFTEWSTTNKKPSPKTKIFDESIIFSISEIPLLLSEKSILEKGLSFCPEIPGYGKLKLMDDFTKIYDSESFFMRTPKQTSITTQNTLKQWKEQ